MKTIALSLILLLAVSWSVSGDDWKLVWSDEFEVDGLPDPGRWTYETGFVRNNEEQFYTRERVRNARVKDGILIIEAHRETMDNPGFRTGSNDWRSWRSQAHYTSASLITKGIAEWTYGKIEVRARVPTGPGTWPAIWTLGANIDEVGWPRCGEIDILEFLGKDPDKIHATAHFGRGGRHDSDSKAQPMKAPWKDFHVYSIEWDSEFIHFAFDGARFQSFRISKADSDGENPFRKPHYLILNLAMGGNWGGPIDDSMLPCQFLIDYVRVYQRQSKE